MRAKIPKDLLIGILIVTLGVNCGLLSILVIPALIQVKLVIDHGFRPPNKDASWEKHLLFSGVIIGDVLLVLILGSGLKFLMTII